MKRLLLLAAVAALGMTLVGSPEPVHAAISKGQDPSHCFCVCFPPIDGRQLCMCVCDSGGA